MTNLDNILKRRDITLLTQVCIVKAMGFPVIISGYESCTKELIFSNCGAGEDPWESLGMQGFWTSQSYRNQSWIVFGRTDAQAEAPILWPSDAKNWLIRKGPDGGKDWRQEKGMTEDEVVARHHWSNGHEFEWALGIGDGQRGLHAVVHGVANSQTHLSDWVELFFQLR